MTTDLTATRLAVARTAQSAFSIASPGEQLTIDAPVSPVVARRADARLSRPVEHPHRETAVHGRRRRAAILDLDGTLVDSNEAHALAWLVALHDFGYEVALDLVRPLIGMPPERILHHAIGTPRDPGEGERIVERRSQIFSTWYLPRLLPFVGTRALLQRMKRDGLRLIVATSALAEEAMALVRASAVSDLLDDVVVGSEAERWPDTDVVAAALARTGCSPDSVILVGDTPYDVAAGVRVGVDVVALRCGGWRDSALRGAAAVYNDACDLLRNFSTSPFFVTATPPSPSAPQLTLMQ